MTKPVRVKGWETGLLYGVNKDGSTSSKLRAITANAILILVNDKRWDGVLAYDEFAESIVTTKSPPWRPSDAANETKPGEWSDADTIRAQAWLSDAYALDLGEQSTLSAVSIASAKRRIHPVRDWLDALRWDGVRRAPSWLIDVFGCDDTPLTRAIATSWLISAVARVYQPGCQVDTVLVLEGDPGVFKSSCLRALVGDEWFFEMAITDVTKLDAMQVLRCKWVAEFPEIDALGRAEQGHVKAYFSRRIDRYRASYGRKAGDYPRQTVFAASTNKDQWIADETGGTGRRMWPIKCRQGDVALIRALRDQLWAEAVARYKSGEAWHISDPELRDDERAEQDERYRADPWEQQIAQWLLKPSDTTIAGKSFPSKADRGVTTLEVLRGAIGFDTQRIEAAHANRIAAALRHLGWIQGKREMRDGARVRPFRPIPSEDADDIGPAVPIDTSMSPVDGEAPTYAGEQLDI